MPKEISMEEKGGRRGGLAAFLGVAAAGCIWQWAEVRGIAPAHLIQAGFWLGSLLVREPQPRVGALLCCAEHPHTWITRGSSILHQVCRTRESCAAPLAWIPVCPKPRRQWKPFFVFLRPGPALCVDPGGPAGFHLAFFTLD